VPFCWDLEPCHPSVSEAAIFFEKCNHSSLKLLALDWIFLCPEYDLQISSFYC